MAKSADRPVGGRATRCPKEIYEIPASSPVHNVTYVTVVEDDSDDEWVDLRDGRRLHRRDDRVGLRGVGHRLVLPAVLRLGRRLSLLLPALPDLRLRRLRTTRGPAPTAAARSRTVRTAAPASASRYNPRTGTYARGAAAYGPYGARGYGAGLQPAHRHLRADAPGLERLRQLGHRPRCSAATSGRQTARVTNNRTGNTTRVHARAAAAGRRHATRGPGRRRGRRSAPAAATSTPAATATSTGSRAAAGRSTTTGTGARRTGRTPSKPAHDRGRATGRARRARRPRRRWTSSTATRGPAPKARSARATTAATSGAAAAARARTGRAGDLAAAAACAGVAAADDSSAPDREGVPMRGAGRPARGLPGCGPTSPGT